MVVATKSLVGFGYPLDKLFQDDTSFFKPKMLDMPRTP